MKRAKGATLAEIIAATGWQAHTVRGFVNFGLLGSGLALRRSDFDPLTIRISRDAKLLAIEGLRVDSSFLDALARRESQNILFGIRAHVSSAREPLSFNKEQSTNPCK
jgi:Protein of unknown function (DUF3489)